MTALEVSLRQIHRQLGSAGAEFALVGGLAVSVRTEPRFTRDADIAVRVANDPEAESLIRSLHDYVVVALVEQEAAGRLATVRLTPANILDAPFVDLLFASSGIEHEVVTDAESIELLPSLTMPVARIGHLVALKVLSRDDIRRPQDFVDLRALLRVATEDELARARQALRLIGDRGYHRGKQLLAEFQQLFASG